MLEQWRTGENKFKFLFHNLHEFLFIYRGLVTYREEYLLYNEKLATTRQRENILTIIAHEYAVS